MPTLRRLLLILCLVAGCSSKTIDFSTEGTLVRLYYTPLHVIGFMAAHPHLIVYDDGVWNRWELYEPDWGGGRHYVCRNRFPLNANVGSGVWGAWIEAEWCGEEAQRIIGILRIVGQDPRAYPYSGEYWFWPGPNSNTFIAWLLRQADVEFDPPWRAWGSSY